MILIQGTKRRISGKRIFQEEKFESAAMLMLAYPPFSPYSGYMEKPDAMLRFGPLAFIVFGAAALLGGIVMAFSDPSGLILMGFGGVFAFVGWKARCLYQPAPGKRHVPVDHNSLILKEYGYKMRTASSVLIEVDETATEAEVEAASLAWAKAKYAERADWVEGRIPQEFVRTGPGQRLTLITWSVIGLIAICAGLIWSGSVWIPATGASAMSLVVIFLYWRAELRRRQHGGSVLALPDGPVVLGGAFRGVVETSLRPDNAPANGFTLTFRCVRRFRVSGGGRNRTTRTERAWTETTTAPPYTIGGKVCTEVRFVVPDTAPPTSLSHEETGVFWELDVTAEMPGLDYATTFTLPVLTPDIAIAVSQKSERKRKP